MSNSVEFKINDFIRRTSIPQLDIAIWNNGASYKSSFGAEINPHVDVFEIGSIGKTFTATLLAILCKSDVVSLDDTVHKFRPDLPFAKNITLKNLVTHTSGLPRDPVKLSWLHPSKNIKKLRDFKKSDYDAFISGLNKPIKPGRFSYSNLGMALLGNILSECVESTYEDAVKKHILLPLGMNDTHVSSQSYETERLATGHNAKGKPVESFVWEGMEPAGVWRSTSKDMMLFLKAHLGYSGDDWESLLSKTTCHAFENPKLQYVGLAWMIQDSDQLGRTVWHNGGTLGQRSMALISKERNMAVILLTNKVPKFWQPFIPKYSLEKLAENVLVSSL